VIASTGRIRLLDPHTINQIAAGEVVERPASVLKELIENAIDSGASRIRVELGDSGKSLIRVSDDGCGMSCEEVRLALQRHATSKITDVEDLQRVGTLGFRGEALPSIASVSRTTISTGTEDGLRFVLEVEGGEVRPERAASGPRGTEVSVEDLLFNTPARLKFLKSDSTELGACLECISRYALGYPGVAFHVTHNRQLAMQTSGSGDLVEAIADVWGREIARSLAEVDTQAGDLRIRGFVSPPHVNRPTRAYQYLYVNGRPVKARTLMAALDQAYRDLTPDRRYPVVVLKIEVPPDRVDVNVSPTKSEVKFQREGQAFDAVRLAVKSSLMEHGMMPSAEGIAAANAALAEARAFDARASDARVWGGVWSGPGNGSEVGGDAAGWTAGWAAGGAPGGVGGPGAFATNAYAASLHLGELSAAAQAPLDRLDVPLPESGIASPHLQRERYPFAELLDGLRVLGQSMNTFIIAETARGIVIIDQHVAHERILYEYLCGLKGATAVERQALLTPATLHLDRRAAVLLRERLDDVAQVGFELEAFGGDSYLVRSAPAALRGADPIKVLRDLVDELVENTVARRLMPTREQIWITSACKMAVKAGDPLGHAEMEKLIVDLASTENPYMCPHGRPITLTLGRDELLRKFKRT
jgi:DNA mismatch repair protein MutL